MKTRQFGEVKIKKQFEFNGFNFAIVEGLKCVECSTGMSVPVFAQHKGTIKSFHEKCVETLNRIYKDLGKEEFESTIRSYE